MRIIKLFSITFLLICITFGTIEGFGGGDDDNVNHESRIMTYGKIPLSFELNQGQTDKDIDYLMRSSRYSLLLKPNGPIFLLNNPLSIKDKNSKILDREKSVRKTNSSRSILQLEFIGAKPETKASGLNQQLGKSNYIIGNDPSKWRTNIPNYSKVEYKDIYTGIDLVYYGNQKQLEYDLVVAPGANFKDINIGFKGTESIVVNSQGDLMVHTSGEKIIFKKPFAYQELNGVQKEIHSSYVIKNNNQIAFNVGTYDTTKTLVIDPVIAYSTYLGGSDRDTGSGIVVDSSGNAYIVGITSSVDFPLANPFQGSLQDVGFGDGDVFITKLNADGNALVYSTYLGGNETDFGEDIALDASGNVFITGGTSSEDFPVSPNAFQSSCAVVPGILCDDAFVTKINSTGTEIIYSTYLGGGITNPSADGDVAFGIDIDSSGNAYVTGFTESPDFPTTSGAFMTSCINSEISGPCDAFVTKINSTGSSLIYSTCIGGTSDDVSNDIKVDTSGNAYITGVTVSLDFPTTNNAFQTDCVLFTDVPTDFCQSAFVTKINKKRINITMLSRMETKNH